jgi:hypothetical protein
LKGTLPNPLFATTGDHTMGVSLTITQTGTNPVLVLNSTGAAIAHKMTGDTSGFSAARYVQNAATSTANSMNIDFSALDTVTERVQNRMNHKWTDNTSATRTSTFILSTSQGGSLSDVMAFIGPDVGIGTLTPSTRAHIHADTTSSEATRIETTATADDPSQRIFQGRIATTTGAAAAVCDVDLTTKIGDLASTTDMVAFVLVMWACRRTGGTSGTAGHGAGGLVTGAVSLIGSTAALIGAPTTLNYDAGADPYSATIGVSGSKVRCLVTGAAATNLTWHVTMFLSPVNS